MGLTPIRATKIPHAKGGHSQKIKISKEIIHSKEEKILSSSCWIRWVYTYVSGWGQTGCSYKSQLLLLLVCLLLETAFGAPLQTGQDGPSHSKFLTLQAAVLFPWLGGGGGELDWKHTELMRRYGSPIFQAFK